MSDRVIHKFSVREPVTAVLVSLSCSLLILHAGPSEATAKSDAAAATCTDSEYRQFDFWLGDWTLTWLGNDGQKLSGTNRISKKYGACVIYEDFRSDGLDGFAGMSVSTFDAAIGLWRQTWVDNQGSYLEFAGEYRDGVMILSREAEREGRKAVWRMVWRNITSDSLDWNYEVSMDGGSTWEVIWEIHYSRNTSAAGSRDNSIGTTSQPLQQISFS